MRLQNNTTPIPYLTPEIIAKSEWVDAFNALLQSLIGVTFLVGLIAWMLSNQLDSLKTARMAESWNATKEQDLKVAELNKETSSLKFGVEEEKRKRQEAELREKQAEVRLAELQASLRTTTEKTEIASKKVEETQSRIQPRRLTKGQRDELKEFLVTVPNETIGLELRNGTPESFDFSSELESVFKESGWKVERSVINRLGGRVFTGIGMAIKSEADAPSWAGKLQEKLVSLGMECPRFIEASVQPKYLKIVIGQKP